MQLRIKERGVVREFDPDSVTPRIARQFRKETGMRPLDVIYAGAEFDIDMAGPLVWLMEMVNGGDRTLEQIEDGLTYRDIEAPYYPDLEPERDATSPMEAVASEVVGIVAEVAADPETQG